jgi:hypothetical protein
MKSRANAVEPPNWSKRKVDAARRAPLSRCWSVCSKDVCKRRRGRRGASESVWQQVWHWLLTAGLSNRLLCFDHAALALGKRHTHLPFSPFIGTTASTYSFHDSDDFVCKSITSTLRLTLLASSLRHRIRLLLRLIFTSGSTLIACSTSPLFVRSSRPHFDRSIVVRPSSPAPN